MWKTPSSKNLRRKSLQNRLSLLQSRNNVVLNASLLRDSSEAEFSGMEPDWWKRLEDDQRYRPSMVFKSTPELGEVQSITIEQSRRIVIMSENESSSDISSIEPRYSSFNRSQSFDYNTSRNAFFKKPAPTNNRQNALEEVIQLNTERRNVSLNQSNNRSSIILYNKDNERNKENFSRNSSLNHEDSHLVDYKSLIQSQKRKSNVTFHTSKRFKDSDLDASEDYTPKVPFRRRNNDGRTSMNGNDDNRKKSVFINAISQPASRENTFEKHSGLIDKDEANYLEADLSEDEQVPRKTFFDNLEADNSDFNEAPRKTMFFSNDKNKITKKSGFVNAISYDTIPASQEVNKSLKDMSKEHTEYVEYDEDANLETNNSDFNEAPRKTMFFANDKNNSTKKSSFVNAISYDTIPASQEFNKSRRDMSKEHTEYVDNDEDDNLEAEMSNFNEAPRKTMFFSNDKNNPTKKSGFFNAISYDTIPASQEFNKSRTDISKEHTEYVDNDEDDNLEAEMSNFNEAPRKTMFFSNDNNNPTKKSGFVNAISYDTIPASQEFNKSRRDISKEHTEYVDNDEDDNLEAEMSNFNEAPRKTMFFSNDKNNPTKKSGFFNAISYDTIPASQEFNKSRRDISKEHTEYVDNDEDDNLEAEMSNFNEAPRKTMFFSNDKNNPTKKSGFVNAISYDTIPASQEFNKSRRDISKEHTEYVDNDEDDNLEAEMSNFNEAPRKTMFFANDKNNPTKKSGFVNAISYDTIPALQEFNKSRRDMSKEHTEYVDNDEDANLEANNSDFNEAPRKTMFFANDKNNSTKKSSFVNAISYDTIPASQEFNKSRRDMSKEHTEYVDNDEDDNLEAEMSNFNEAPRKTMFFSNDKNNPTKKSGFFNAISYDTIPASQEFNKSQRETLTDDEVNKSTRKTFFHSKSTNTNEKKSDLANDISLDTEAFKEKSVISLNQASRSRWSRSIALTEKDHNNTSEIHGKARKTIFESKKHDYNKPLFAGAITYNASKTGELPQSQSVHDKSVISQNQALQSVHLVYDNISENCGEPRNAIFKLNKDDNRTHVFAGAITYNASKAEQAIHPQPPNDVVGDMLNVQDNTMQFSPYNATSDSMFYERIKAVASSTIIGGNSNSTPIRRSLRRSSLSQFKSLNNIAEENRTVNSKSYPPILEKSNKKRSSIINNTNEAANKTSSRNKSLVRNESRATSDSPILGNTSKIRSNKSSKSKSNTTSQKDTSTEKVNIGTPEALLKLKSVREEPENILKVSKIDATCTPPPRKLSIRACMKNSESEDSTELLNQSEIDRAFMEEMNAKRTNPPVRRSTIIPKVQEDNDELENETSKFEDKSYKSRYPLRHSNIPVGVHAMIPMDNSDNANEIDNPSENEDMVLEYVDSNDETEKDNDVGEEVAMDLYDGHKTYEKDAHIEIEVNKARSINNIVDVLNIENNVETLNENDVSIKQVSMVIENIVAESALHEQTLKVTAEGIDNTINKNSSLKENVDNVSKHDFSIKHVLGAKNVENVVIQPILNDLGNFRVTVEVADHAIENVSMKENAATVDKHSLSIKQVSNVSENIVDEPALVEHTSKVITEVIDTAINNDISMLKENVNDNKHDLSTKHVLGVKNIENLIQPILNDLGSKVMVEVADNAIENVSMKENAATVDKHSLSIKQVSNVSENIVDEPALVEHTSKVITEVIDNAINNVISMLKENVNDNKHDLSTKHVLGAKNVENVIQPILNDLGNFRVTVEVADNAIENVSMKENAATVDKHSLSIKQVSNISENIVDEPALDKHTSKVITEVIDNSINNDISMIKENVNDNKHDLSTKQVLDAKIVENIAIQSASNDENSKVTVEVANNVIENDVSMNENTDLPINQVSDGKNVNEYVLAESALKDRTSKVSAEVNDNDIQDEDEVSIHTQNIVSHSQGDKLFDEESFTNEADIVNSTHKTSLDMELTLENESSSNIKIFDMPSSLSNSEASKRRSSAQKNNESSRMTTGNNHQSYSIDSLNRESSENSMSGLEFTTNIRNSRLPSMNAKKSSLASDVLRRKTFFFTSETYRRDNLNRKYSLAQNIDDKDVDEIEATNDDVEDDWDGGDSRFDQQSTAQSHNGYNHMSEYTNTTEPKITDEKIKIYDDLMKKSIENRERLAEEQMKALFARRQEAVKLISNLKQLTSTNLFKKPKTPAPKNIKNNLAKELKIAVPVIKKRKLYMKEEWITPRLYNFVQKKLEPKYGIRTRNRSEKFVRDLASIVNEVVNSKKDYHIYVKTLKIEMARLKLVVTHDDFHRFVIDYLPAFFRLRSIPACDRDVPPIDGSVFDPIRG